MKRKLFMPPQLLDKLEVTFHLQRGQFELVENKLSHYDKPELTSHHRRRQFELVENEQSHYDKHLPYDR